MAGTSRCDLKQLARPIIITLIHDIVVEQNRLLSGMVKIVQTEDRSNGTGLCNDKTCPTMSAGGYVHSLDESGPSDVLTLELGPHTPGSIPTVTPSTFQPRPISSTFRLGSLAKFRMRLSSLPERSSRRLHYLSHSKLAAIHIIGSESPRDFLSDSKSS